MAQRCKYVRAHTRDQKPHVYTTIIIKLYENVINYYTCVIRTRQRVVWISATHGYACVHEGPERFTYNIKLCIIHYIILCYTIEIMENKVCR